MKKKTEKEPKSMTFMVTKLVTISGCSFKKAKQIAENVSTPEYGKYGPLQQYTYPKNDCIKFSTKTETVIPVEVKK